MKPWVLRAIRLGYAAKGLIYSLIGVLALRVAFGMRDGALTDASGVLLRLLRQPFGRFMIAAISVGILTYCIYHVVEGVADLRRKGGGVRGWTARALTIIKAGVYGTIGLEALRLVFFNSRSSGDAEDHAALAMSLPLGRVILTMVGAGVLVYGLTQLKMAWDGKADEDLDITRVRREARWILPFGRVGTAARSVILVMMGATLLAAGLRARPSDADGYSEALSTMASFHPLLLGSIGAGLLCFGLFQLCHARFAKIPIA